MSKLLRRDFLKGRATIPFGEYFGFAFKDNISKELSGVKSKDNHETLKIGQLEAPEEKLLPPTGKNGKCIRVGLNGNGWRGEQLMQSLGHMIFNTQ